MPGTVNGFSLAYTAVGGVVLWSGITGQSLTSTFQSVIKGQAPKQAPNPAQNAEVISTVSGTGSEPGVSLPSTVSESTWVSDFLSALGAPQTAANVSSVEDWIAHEGPFGSQGQNNPLNTTQAAAGSTSFNGLAVQNYPSPSEGLEATVETLLNGSYPDILMRLKSGQGLKSGASNGLLTWSGGGYSSV